MENQTIFNILVTVCGFLAAWTIKTVWGTIQELHHDHHELSAKVSAVEVLVAGQYVRKEDFDRTLANISAKLDRIEDKLDGKVDK